MKIGNASAKSVQARKIENKGATALGKKGAADPLLQQDRRTRAATRHLNESLRRDDGANLRLLGKPYSAIKDAKYDDLDGRVRVVVRFDRKSLGPDWTEDRLQRVINKLPRTLASAGFSWGCWPLRGMPSHLPASQA